MSIPSLRDISGSYIIKNKLAVDEQSNSCIILFQRWEAIKNAGPIVPSKIKHEMTTIEKEVLAQFNVNKEEPIVRLTKQVDQLFIKLSEKCGIKEICGDIIPVTEIHFALLGQAWADEALFALWEELGKTIALPDLTTPQEKRAYLEAPEMAQALSQITQLNLSGKNLKIFPSEIKLCTGLVTLNLTNNQIAEIPENLSLPMLETLCLSRNQLTTLPALNFPQLKLLELTMNQLTAFPSSNLPQLKHLLLAHNQITALPVLNFPLLLSLFLSNNQITVLFALNCPLLRNLFLCNNQLTTLPAFNFLQLSELSLHGNMFLFICDKDKNNMSTNYCTSLLDQFSTYKCKSKLAQFFQSIGLDTLDKNSMKSAFYDLKKKDQELVFEMVCQVSGISSPDLDCVEHYTLDDMHIFHKAMRKAVSTKFDRLSPNDKSKVYELCGVDRPPQITDAKWGKHHAFDHVLRLIDAMSFIE